MTDQDHSGVSCRAGAVVASHPATYKTHAIPYRNSSQLSFMLYTITKEEKKITVVLPDLTRISLDRKEEEIDIGNNH